MKRNIMACTVTFSLIFGAAWMADIHLKNMPNEYQLNVYQQSNDSFLHNFEVQTRHMQLKEFPFKAREYIRKQQMND